MLYSKAKFRLKELVLVNSSLCWPYLSVVAELVSNPIIDGGMGHILEILVFNCPWHSLDRWTTGQQYAICWIGLNNTTICPRPEIDQRKKKNRLKATESYKVKIFQSKYLLLSLYTTIQSIS